MKSYKKLLPSLKDLELVGEKIKQIGNRRGEFLRRIHYSCYLLCSESGLRISEVARFDLNAKTQKGLYRINKCKGNKVRYVYVSKEVIRKLKKNKWKPNQTNRWNFYHFLKKVKKELGISKEIELTPHTFRRAFTTYHANSGMPLPLLSKLLGHSSIRTTALYWRDIYGEDEVGDILVGKKWLENREKEPLKPPIAESDLSLFKAFDKGLQNFPQSKNSDSGIVKNKPLITAEKPHDQDNLLLTIETKKNSAITNEIPSKNQGKFSLNTSEQSNLIKGSSKFYENFVLPVIIKKREKLTKEEILLEKIKQLEENLISVEQQLAEVQAENNLLKVKNKLIRKEQETEAKVIQPFKVKS